MPSTSSSSNGCNGLVASGLCTCTWKMVDGIFLVLQSRKLNMTTQTPLKYKPLNVNQALVSEQIVFISDPCPLDRYSMCMWITEWSHRCVRWSMGNFIKMNWHKYLHVMCFIGCTWELARCKNHESNRMKLRKYNACDCSPVWETFDADWIL